MSLEFAASRLLIPVFGSSIYTWGSLIGVILACLSLGYHVGGRLADKKNPTFMKFCSIIFSAGLYIVFIPLISPAVISFSSSVAPATTNNSQYSSLLATFVLLITPTFLLGIVSPYAVKLATKTLSRLGNIAGNLYSAATMGSIICTFLTVFVLIPSFEIKYIIFALGLTLIIPSSIVGLRKLPKILAGCIVIVLLLFVSNTFSLVGLVSPASYYYPGGTIIHQAETPYSHLDVVDFGNNTNNNVGGSNTRVLYLNGLEHSMMSKDDPNKLAVDYTQYFPLGFVFNPTAKNVLFVGGGGFSGPKYFLNTYHNFNVSVVEIDPVVTQVAERYFDLNNNNPRLKIYTDDARNFLSSNNSQSKKNYDLIILDAYSRDYIPFHLMTLQYFQLLYNKLTPNGVIVSNQIGSLVGDASNLYRAVYKTMTSVFPAVYAFPVEPDSNTVVQNIILVAAKNPADIVYHNQSKIRQQQMKLISDSNSNNNISSDYFKNDNVIHSIDYAQYLYDSAKIKTNDVPLLTDQYAPVENLLNPITGKPYNIDEQSIAPAATTASTTSKIDMHYTQNTLLLSVVIPLVISSIWILCMHHIWRKRTEEEEGADLVYQQK